MKQLATHLKFCEHFGKIVGFPRFSKIRTLCFEIRSWETSRGLRSIFFLLVSLIADRPAESYFFLVVLLLVFLIADRPAESLIIFSYSLIFHSLRFSIFVLARSHDLGFGGKVVELHPTCLPDLFKPLRDSQQTQQA